ncbi:PREDICTED: uncharacterized protein LOC109591058 [Amphimedon queenslandica]|uniref:Uncharacterized protein n=1 Tax=Amphimedon queenslandica TaxID=400682 RepID=A0A1X7SX45_AMPQE|nr:PREDICTED: uncharacterized protein LOC109591058 [Amphimedon queenslandica]|eukprot:XP_019862423.1 PREDICTED: uncharacterized protein LOC109591058 [Amphimedon queenslandica]
MDDATQEKTETDDKKILGSSVHSHTSTSSGSVTFDESSYEGQLILHREFLEIVYYLCSDVSLRKNVHHLNLLCNKFPCLSQDSSLYWKTMTLLSLFHYTQTNRRLIQSKFDGLTFDEIFSTTRQYYQTHELLKDPPSSPTGQAPSADSDTTCNRRRNSTGEILKTKPADHTSLMRVGSSHSEEKLDTKSIATTTTASEMDTLSEGSLTSNEMLEWEGEGGEGGGVKDEGERVREDQIPSLAEAGNRLSQLELDVGTSSSMPPSIVEVVIDL